MAKLGSNTTKLLFQVACENSLCCDVQAVVMGIQEVTVPRFVSSGWSTNDEDEGEADISLMLLVVSGSNHDD